jgi:hypothetical protein
MTRKANPNNASECVSDECASTATSATMEIEGIPDNPSKEVSDVFSPTVAQVKVDIGILKEVSFTFSFCLLPLCVY